MKIVDIKPDYDIRCDCCSYSGLIGRRDCPVMQGRLLSMVIGRGITQIYILRNIIPLVLLSSGGRRRRSLSC